MIGIPAAVALASAPLIASAFGTETARPSTFCDTAASISCASFWGSLFEGLQMSLTPSSSAAHREDREGHRREQCETAEPSSHRSATSLSGASLIRYSMLLATSRTGPS